jgi:hypothetical protein
VSELPEDGTVVPKHVGVITDYTNVYVVCALVGSFSILQQSLVGQGLLIIDASLSHTFRHTLDRTPLDE